MSYGTINKLAQCLLMKESYLVELPHGSLVQDISSAEIGADGVIGLVAY